MPLHRGRQPGFGILLLLYQIFQVIGIDRIPPVTLSIVGVQVAVYLRLFALPWHKTSQICVSAYKVWHRKEYMRLLYAAFEHGDDWHLYYNMVSFVWKGQSLERRFGSVKFLYILSVFTFLTNVTLVALNEIAGGYDRNYLDHCAIGFSGVIFALKVLTTHHDTNYTNYVMGIPIALPARYAVWAELVLIQLLVPNVSFFGHLAGILVGMAYVKGPLKYLMDLTYSAVTSIVNPRPNHQRFTPRAETSGYRNEHFVPHGMSEEEQIRQAMAASMTEEEQLRQAMDASLNEHSSSPTFGSSPPTFGSPPPTFGFNTPSTSRGYNSPPPPPGFVFDHQGSVHTSPPSAGFSPDIEELRRQRQAHFTYR